MTKFCKDCKHYLPYQNETYSKCGRNSPPIDQIEYLVTGKEVVQPHNYCSSERGSSNGCRIEARFFEQKNSDSV